MRWLTAAFAWQSRAVVERHLRVHMRNWHTAFLPPALEPVTSLLAFGLGLGSYVGARTAVSRGSGFVRVFFVVVVGAFIVRIGWTVVDTWT